MEVEVVGGVGWSTPYHGCFSPRNDPVRYIEEGGWALGLVQTATKITSPLGFELRTVQRIVSHCATYTVTPHQEHNDVNVNKKISDIHGGHFLVSYTMWWLNSMVFWRDVLPTLSEP